MCNITCAITNKTNHLRTKKHKNKENDTEISIIIGSRGRPWAKPLPNNKKVKNPESGRQIRTNTQLFRKLSKKYGYDDARNEFLMYVIYPLNNNRKIVKNDVSI